ncbi:AAA family ATPase [Pseudoalteromonas sp. NBT06-2]|uniref:ExeA family protein n=1 Tax=Pseudoalteromonas sp. NBT06-2 TaxID=2025950 RepID=UPI000BA6B6A5|nr:AAA family ATPase [Pseudoalteromonas sp. NBT06-2]PAJ76053.1 AAA family ATPase [Pseudoalteromonas sp. NBT06-2]
MYLSFFGLIEKPFSIAPNPEYLFLSDRHKEALAHLTFGLGDAGGFVLLTGEVGTGKTTVTRCMLAELPDTTQVAFVLNPSLSELELLASICDELRIRYKKSDASLKNLTDKIKNRLLKNHQSGGHTMLIIDEAQHLAPAVLEQLRLLTNLETNHKKLLQIILVGQPELQQLLKRNELRQLAQRITARYHLLPLTEAQVFAYIQHRLNKAGNDTPIFATNSIKLIHQLTAGIPRLINLLCDRALMGAFANQQQKINKHIVKQAATEVLPLQPEQESKKVTYSVMLSMAALLCITAGFALSFIF